MKVRGNRQGWLGVVLLVGALLFFLTAGSAPAGVTYDFTKVVSGPVDSWDFNNHDQIAYQVGGGVYLWDNFTTDNIMNTFYGNFIPHINNNGIVTFVSNNNLCRYVDGEVETLVYIGWTAKHAINDENEIFYLMHGDGTRLYRISGTTIDLLTTYTYDPDVRGFDSNNNGDVVWGQGDIVLFRNGSAAGITQNILREYNPSFNDNDQVVFQLYDGNDWEIILWSHGQVTQLTNNLVDDINPNINQSGEIVWLRRDDTDWDIFSYHDHSINRVTNNSYDEVCPLINDEGHILFYQGGNDPGLYMATPAQEINYFAAVTLTDGRQYATLAYIRADLGFYMGWNQADQNDRFAAFYQVTEEDYYYKKYTFFYQYQNESPWYGFGYTSDTFGYYYAWNSQQSQQYFLGLFLMTGEGNFTYLYNFAGGGLYMGQGYAQPDSGYCYAFPIGNAAVYTMTSYTLTSGVQSMPFLGYWTLINSGSLLDYYD